MPKAKTFEDRTIMKKFTIDLSKASEYIDGEHDRIIREALSKKNYLSGFIYSVIDGENLDMIKKTGTYRKEESIFSFKLEEFLWNTGINCIKSLALQYEQPAVAIYKADCLERVDSEGSWMEYFFKNPDNKKDSLEAIAMLKL